MKNEKYIFKSGTLSVSETMLKFKGRRYKLEHIENLILKRNLFYIGAAFGMMLFSFTVANADLLYWSELLIASGLSIAIPTLSWPIGTLTMHSRTLSTSEGSITWFYKDLAKAQDAVEHALVTLQGNNEP